MPNRPAGPSEQYKGFSWSSTRNEELESEFVDVQKETKGYLDKLG